MTVSGIKNHARLTLWPNISYRFRVVAINEVGKSEPSKPTEIHKTVAEGKRRCPVSFMVIVTNTECFPQSQHQTTTLKMSGVSPQTQTLWSSRGRYSGNLLYIIDQLFKRMLAFH